MATCYLGEKSGGRVLAYGDATTQVGTDFQVSLTTWDVVPAGEVGDVLFRAINVTLIATSGYAIGITPIVDGASLAEQTFTGPDTGEVQAQAFFATRGTRCAAKVRTLSRSGDLVIHNVQVSLVVIRTTP